MRRLVDLLVVLALAALGLAGALYTNRSFSAQADRQRQIDEVQANLRLAMSAVERAVRGAGAGMAGFKLSVVMTRQNIAQLDAFKAIADQFGAQLRITRLRPSGRGADVWNELHPLPGQQRELYDWLVAPGEAKLEVVVGQGVGEIFASGI